MSISDAISRALSDIDGAAGVEFALMSPALILLMFGAVDIGGLAYQQAEVAAAAHAGAMFPMAPPAGVAVTAANIKTAIQSATPLGTAVTPTVTTVYYCVSGTGALTSSSSGATCTTGGPTAGTYYQITVQSTYTPLISWGTLSFPATLSAKALVRVQ